MDAYREFHSLHLPHLIRYVLPVAQLKKGELEIGSGVLVRAGGRHFVATAKHCIDGSKVRGVFATSPLQMSRATGTRDLRILQVSWHNTLDLGYLEIADPECAELRWDQLSDDRIVSGMVNFIGYPEVLTQAVEEIPGRLTEVSLCAGTFSTTLTEETVDCMTFDYPKSGWKYDEVAGVWNDSPFPETPRGFSGGACFGVSQPAGGIIAQVEYKLLGVQYAWHSGKRVVRATPIKRWCELLVERGLSQP